MSLRASVIQLKRIPRYIFIRTRGVPDLGWIVYNQYILWTRYNISGAQVFNMVSMNEDPRSNLKRIHDASLLRAQLSSNDSDFDAKLDAHKEAIKVAFAGEVMRGVLPHEIVASEVCDSTKTACSTTNVM